MENKYPEPGFYRKYDWAPSNPLGVGIVEVLGVTYDTDNKGSVPKVLYRPLDSNMRVYTQGRATEFKSLEGFLDTREHNGETMLRFQRIEDPIMIANLEDLRNEMYPNAIAW